MCVSIMPPAVQFKPLPWQGRREYGKIRLSFTFSVRRRLRTLNASGNLGGPIMSRMRLFGTTACAAVALMVLVSAFRAQQPTPPKKEPVPPQVFDPGFVPGQQLPGQGLPPEQQKLVQQYFEQLKQD